MSGAALTFPGENESQNTANFMVFAGNVYDAVLTIGWTRCDERRGLQPQRRTEDKRQGHAVATVPCVATYGNAVSIVSIMTRA